MSMLKCFGVTGADGRILKIMWIDGWRERGREGGISDQVNIA